ncbi:hypothetical protein ACHWQZ_G005521 [Mnemiopsis leidyi]
MKSSVGAVVTLLSLTVMLGKMGGAVETTKCYNCTIEETKYDTDGKDQVNRKIYDSEQHGELEACPESTCNGSCVSAIDTSNAESGELIYYRTCDGEDPVCERFGIVEEFCNTTRCQTDLCNGQRSVTFTLGLVLLAVLSRCL